MEGSAFAQQKAQKSEKSAERQQQARPAAPAVPALPDPYKLNMMIRSSIIALNQANKTGNYTVLQDLGSPAFRASNNSARLAQIFGKLRQRDLDLTPILFFKPKLVQQPKVAPNGILRLAGYFPTSPERVNFDLYFQFVGGDWRIFGIGVNTTRADVTAAAPPQAQNGAGQKNASKKTNGARAVAKQVTPASAPPPARKPQAPRQAAAQPAGESQPGETRNAVENGTINNATRIDLSRPQPRSESGSQEDTPSAAQDGGTGSTEEGATFWDSFNPFAPK